MSMDLVHHLTKRAVKSGIDCMSKNGHKIGGGSIHSISVSQTPEPIQDIFEKLQSPAAILVFSITFILWGTITFLTEYPIRYVATSLAIVEDVEPNGAIKLPVADEAGAPLMNDYDIAIEHGDAVQPQPITTGIRSTFKHLNTTNGFFSKWRGIGLGIFYGIIFTVFLVIFTAFFSFIPVVGVVIARLAAGMVTCNLHAAWTHAMIATKSEKPFFQQFLSRRAAKHLMFPTARNQLALMFMSGASLSMAAAVHKVSVQHGPKYWAVPVLSVLTLILPFIIFFFIVMPSHIALVRSEASLLPEDRSAIVPFDRTFGGRINWQELDTRKAYFRHNFSLKGAYSTFDKKTYLRVAKMSIKLTIILLSIALVFGILFMAEFFTFARRN